MPMVRWFRHLTCRLLRHKLLVVIDNKDPMRLVTCARCDYAWPRDMDPIARENAIAELRLRIKRWPND